MPVRGDFFPLFFNYVNIPYDHKRARNILRTRLKKEMVALENLSQIPDSSMKKTAVDKAKGKNQGSAPGLIG